MPVPPPVSTIRRPAAFVDRIGDGVDQVDRRLRRPAPRLSGYFSTIGAHTYCDLVDALAAPRK